MTDFYSYYNKPDLNPLYYTQALLSATTRRNWIYNPLDAEMDDGMAFEKLRRDAATEASVQNRIRATAGVEYMQLPASGRPEDQQVATLQTWLTGHVDDHLMARQNLAKAPFLGEAYAAIVGEWVLAEAPGDTKERVWWVPRRLVDVGKYRFRRVGWQDEPGGPIRAEWQFKSLARDRWERLRNPRIFVRHLHEVYEGTLGHGRGLIHTLVYWIRIKQLLLEQGLEFCEKWAQGVLTAKIDSLRLGSAGDTTNEQHRQYWITELERIRSRNVLVYGSEDELIPVWPQGTGYEANLKMVDYMDRQMQRLIEARVDAGISAQNNSGSGGYGSARVGAREKDDYYTPDILRLGQVLDRQHNRVVFAQNRRSIRGYLADQGLPMGRPSTFYIGSEERHDPKHVLAVVQVAKKFKMPLKREWVYKSLGVPMPSPGDELFDTSVMDGELEQILGPEDQDGMAPEGQDAVGPEGQLEGV